MENLFYTFHYLKDLQDNNILNNEIAVMRKLQENGFPHSHSFLEIVYIEEGECDHLINGEKSHLKKGDYFIIDYNCVHQFILEKNKTVQLINCLFDPAVIDPTLKNCNSFKNLVSSYQIGIRYDILKFNPSNYIFHDETGLLHPLFVFMLHEYNEHMHGYIDFIRHSISQIIIMTLRQIYDYTNAEKSSIVTTMIKKAQTQFTEECLLKNICKELNYSMPYLSSKFKSSMGISFKEYQTKIRIDNACQLLTKTNKTVSEIALLVGYKNVDFFTSIFKSKTTITPGQFRKTASQKASITR